MASSTTSSSKAAPASEEEADNLTHSMKKIKTSRTEPTQDRSMKDNEEGTLKNEGSHRIKKG